MEFWKFNLHTKNKWDKKSAKKSIKHVLIALNTVTVVNLNPLTKIGWFYHIQNIALFVYKYSILEKTTNTTWGLHASLPWSYTPQILIPLIPCAAITIALNFLHNLLSWNKNLSKQDKRKESINQTTLKWPMIFKSHETWTLNYNNIINKILSK
jgi:hypothetical protein